MSSRISRFEALVERQPNNELFRFSLAEALLGENRAADAVPHLQFCADAKADWMMPRVLLGKALLQLGHHTQAKPVLEAALSLAREQHHEDPERELGALLAEI